MNTLFLQEVLSIHTIVFEEKKFLAFMPLLFNLTAPPARYEAGIGSRYWNTLFLFILLLAGVSLPTIHQWKEINCHETI